MARGRKLMRWLGLLASVALATSPGVVSATEVSFVYVRPNVGGASGGHAGFIAGDIVYHLQTDGDGLFRIVRDRWAHFEYLYGKLQNRPLSIAHVVVSDAVRDALLDRFARVYVEQDLDYLRRDARALDLAWLEALREGRPLPPLAAAGLLSPQRADDPDARALVARLRERVGSAALASASVQVDALDPAVLREQLALREALQALEHAQGLDPEALVALPATFDDPLTSQERSALESLAAELELDIGDLLLSRRPDRGYVLLLLEARFLAIQRSLAENRLRVLDPFDGAARAHAARTPRLSPSAYAQRLEYFASVLRLGRLVLLAPGGLDAASYNLLEEVAAVVERAARNEPGAELIEVSRRQPPMRGRSVAIGSRARPSEAQLVAARSRLASAEARLHERWAYALLVRNCITELSDVVAAAFESLDAADAALGGRIPKGEPLAAIPAVFFSRVRERLRVVRVEERPSHRIQALATLTQRDPRAWVRAREAIAPLSHIYSPRPRDGAFLLFTDDVFWRRPLYGTANVAYGIGYTAFGMLASPFDGGEHWKIGAIGMLWSLPELGFQNLRKGTFEFVDPEEP
jgi:hypothetical protein